ncbi:MAG: isopropylmalate isomerase, partial [Tsuneonella sp.]
MTKKLTGKAIAAGAAIGSAAIAAALLYANKRKDDK